MTDFERLMLPHLDAAFRLAVWLVRDESASQDIVQESYLRAFKAWHRFQPGNERAWLLTIVHRCSLDWLKRTTARAFIDIDDEAMMSPEEARALRDNATPEDTFIQGQSAAKLKEAIMELAPAFREVILLKDIEELSYKSIAAILNVPIGTVMSRLARGRDLLRRRLVGVTP